MQSSALMKTDFPELTLLNTGKVRDVYDLGDTLLVVATDRISAFDVVMDQPIPGKGEILTRMSAFWFGKTADIIENHYLTSDVDAYPDRCGVYRDVLRGRSMLVKKARPLPVECVVRGYLSGSGWKDYCRDRTVSGIVLPPGLRESERLPEPLFTPSSKAPQGDHDLPITREEVAGIVGAEVTERLAAASIAVYRRAADIAAAAGIIIADTKMEFGIYEGRVILIDELLTPDSSRFWPTAGYAPGGPQQSFDKQFLRDYLLSLPWNQQPPPPPLPDAIIARTAEKYAEALQRLLR